MSFLKPKMPKLPPPVPIPRRTDAQVQEAAGEQRRKLQLETTATDWLTGGLGIPRKPENYAGSKMLGGR